MMAIHASRGARGRSTAVWATLRTIRKGGLRISIKMHLKTSKLLADVYTENKRGGGYDFVVTLNDTDVMTLALFIVHARGGSTSATSTQRLWSLTARCARTRLERCLMADKPVEPTICPIDGCGRPRNTKNPNDPRCVDCIELRLSPPKVEPTSLREKLLIDRANSWLSNGGLFSPESMPPDAARDLIIDFRDCLAAALLAAESAKHDCEAWAMEGLGCAGCNPAAQESRARRLAAEAGEPQKET